MNLNEAKQRLLDLAIANEGKTLLVNRYGIAQWLQISDSRARGLMAELRHDKKCYFVPAGKKGLYVLYVEGVNDGAVLAYVLNQVAHIRSSYFNNVVPFMDILHKHKQEVEYNRLINVVGQIALAFPGEQK